MTRVRILIAFILGLMGGAVALSIAVGSFEGKPGWDFLGAIIGAALGAVASIFVWVLAYAETEARRRKEKHALVVALWADTIALQDVLYREAAWWSSATQQNHLDIERRVRSHFDTPVFNANMHRIGELSLAAGDGLLVLRAGVIALRELMDLYYVLDREMVEGPERPGAGGADRLATSKRSRRRIHQDMLDTAVRARITARHLDADGEFARQRASILAKGRAPGAVSEIAAMNAELDKVAAHHPDRF
jgi:hypothetical protein